MEPINKATKRPLVTTTTNSSAPRRTPAFAPPLGVHPTSIAAQIGVGIAVASFWRGAWYFLDDNLFPHNPLYSAAASLTGGTAGLTITQGFMARKAAAYRGGKSIKLPSYYPPVARFGTLYCVSLSCVMVWRGAWMLMDIGYEEFHKFQENEVKATEPGHLTKSGLISHFAAVGGLLACGRFSSVLAPPAGIAIVKDLAMKATTWKEYSKYAKWWFH